MGSLRKGVIRISWEVKDDDWCAVSVEMPPQARRLPLVFRRRIVTRFREMLIPAKGDRR